MPRHLQCALLAALLIAVQVIVATERAHFGPTDTLNSFLKRLLFKYNSEEHPGHMVGSGAVDQVAVNLSMHIASFTEISVSRMDFQVDMYLAQQWTDRRLQYTGSIDILELSGNIVDNIWNPDTFFPTEKTASRHDITRRNAFIKIYPNGTVYSNQRLRMTFACFMHLHWYPVDSQVCPIVLEAYGHNEKQLKFHWFQRPYEASAVTLDPHGMLSPQFALPSLEVEEKSVSYGGSDERFSSASIKFKFRREIGFYLLDSYLPFVCIVLVSMTSCWISPAAAPARCTIGVVTILSMVVHNSGNQRKVASVSYMKALDLYFIVCLSLVILSWFEFIMAHQIFVTAEKNSKANRRNSRSKCSKLCSQWHTLDKLTRALMPTFFLLFNVSYWVVLAVHRD